MPTFNNGESGASVREKINEAINKVESIETSLVNINAKLDALLSADILGLFANGEQGAWYDPSDLTTLYQDAAGTTPVTADGDPVGLMLDKSKGPKLGPELVTNGGPFNDTSDWDVSAGGSLSVNNGLLRITTNGGEEEASYTLTGLTVGSYYKIQLNIANETQTSGSPFYNIFGDTGSTPFDDSVDITVILKASATSQTVLVSTGGSAVSGEYIEIESLSVRELPGNHATQSTAAARPVYRTDGTLHWLEFDGVDDCLTIPTPGFSLQAFSLLVGAEETTEVNNAALVVLAPTLGDDFSQADAAVVGETGNNNSNWGAAAGGTTSSDPNSLRASISGSGATPLAVWETHIGASSTSVFKNGGSENKDSEYTVGETHTGNMILGARYLNGAISSPYLNGKIYSIIARSGSLVEGSDRASARSYVAAKAGITL